MVQLSASPHPAHETTVGEARQSLIAVAAHFAALAYGRRSFYTAPTKALVSEKFFSNVASFSRNGFHCLARMCPTSIP